MRAVSERVMKFIQTFKHPSRTLLLVYFAIVAFFAIGYIVFPIAKTADLSLAGQGLAGLAGYADFLPPRFNKALSPIPFLLVLPPLSRVALLALRLPSTYAFSAKNTVVWFRFSS